MTVRVALSNLNGRWNAEDTILTVAFRVSTVVDVAGSAGEVDCDDGWPYSVSPGDEQDHQAVLVGSAIASVYVVAVIC